MTYKDLLVHLDDSKGCAQRVHAAVRLTISASPLAWARNWYH